MDVNDLIERIVEVFRQYEEERGISVFGLGESEDERKRRTEKEKRREIRRNSVSPK